MPIFRLPSNKSILGWQEQVHFRLPSNKSISGWQEQVHFRLPSNKSISGWQEQVHFRLPRTSPFQVAKQQIHFRLPSNKSISGCKTTSPFQVALTKLLSRPMIRTVLSSTNVVALWMDQTPSRQVWHFQVKIGSLWDCEYKAWTNVTTFLLETFICVPFHCPGIACESWEYISTVLLSLRTSNLLSLEASITSPASSQSFSDKYQSCHFHVWWYIWVCLASVCYSMHIYQPN